MDIALEAMRPSIYVCSDAHPTGELICVLLMPSLLWMLALLGLVLQIAGLPCADFHLCKVSVGTRR